MVPGMHWGAPEVQAHTCYCSTRQQYGDNPHYWAPTLTLESYCIKLRSCHAISPALDGGGPINSNGHTASTFFTRKLREYAIGTNSSYRISEVLVDQYEPISYRKKKKKVTGISAEKAFRGSNGDISLPSRQPPLPR